MNTSLEKLFKNKTNSIVFLLTLSLVSFIIGILTFFISTISTLFCIFKISPLITIILNLILLIILVYFRIKLLIKFKSFNKSNSFLLKVSIYFNILSFILVFIQLAVVGLIGLSIFENSKIVQEKTKFIESYENTYKDLQYK